MFRPFSCGARDCDSDQRACRICAVSDQACTIPEGANAQLDRARVQPVHVLSGLMAGRMCRCERHAVRSDQSSLRHFSSAWCLLPFRSLPRRSRQIVADTAAEAAHDAMKALQTRVRASLVQEPI